MSEFKFNDFNNQDFSANTDNLRDNARSSTFETPSAFSMNSNSTVNKSFFGFQQSENQNSNAFSVSNNQSQDWSNAEPQANARQSEPQQFSQPQAQPSETNVFSFNTQAYNQANQQQNNYQASEPQQFSQPQAPTQPTAQPSETNVFSFNTQAYNQANQQQNNYQDSEPQQFNQPQTRPQMEVQQPNQATTPVRFNSNVDASKLVRYGASSDQAPVETTYKYRSNAEPISVPNVVANEATANVETLKERPQPVVVHEIEQPKETKSGKKYTFFEDTEEDIVIETKEEHKAKLKQQQREEKLLSKTAKKEKVKQNLKKEEKENAKPQAIKTLFSEASEDEEVVAKNKVKSISKPVSFLKMFFIRIIMLLPILGILYCLVLSILPKTNKNIRSLAVTTFIFEAIGYAILAFFLLNGGLGYLVEWFFDMNNYVSYEF